jgi:hypothetical protein
MKKCKKLTPIVFDWNDFDRVSQQYKPDKAKGFRIKFLGGFIQMDHKKKQCWNRIGDARSAFVNEMRYSPTFSEIIYGLIEKYKHLNPNDDYYFESNLIHDLLNELETQKIVEFVEV